MYFFVLSNFNPCHLIVSSVSITNSYWRKKTKPPMVALEKSQKQISYFK